MACHPMLHLVQVLESAPDALKKAWKSGHLDAVNAWVKEAPRAFSFSMWDWFEWGLQGGSRSSLAGGVGNGSRVW